jgi:hypothetical protein
VVPGGGSIFTGSFGHAIVINEAGEMFSGNVNQLEGMPGVQTPQFKIEGGNLIPIYENLKAIK